MGDRAIEPEFLLFVQHGWADDNRAMLDLAKRLVTDITPIIAPDLGFIQTWLKIDPLIDNVEAIASAHLAPYPSTPIRIIGHSMGGLIWLEVLRRHPEWRSRVHSLVLVGSPVGGSDLSRLIDPLGMGIGIAADLGVSRVHLAEAIAKEIPTLILAGDVGYGTDGTVPTACMRFAHAQYVCLPGVSHSALRNHPTVAATIRDFWVDTTIGETILDNDIIRRLRAAPGMTDGHCGDFPRATTIMTLANGGTVRLYDDAFGIDRVFLACPEGKCLYAGYVGWFHTQDLQEALEDIKQAYAVGVG
jgi:pimeloyl-ACP methyl ester carboxylesterase